MRRSVAAAIAVIAIVSSGSPESACAQDGPADDVALHIQLLSSPGPKDRAAGDAWLARSGDRAIRLLLKRLQSPDTAVRQKSARDLQILISPFARGSAAAGAHRGFIDLALNRRPVERSWLHPRAADVRQAAMAALDRLIGGIDRPVRNAKNPGWPGWPVTEEVRALAALIAEVADDATINQLVERTVGEKNIHLGTPLFAAVELALGIPALWRQGLMCGNSTEEEFKAFAATQQEHGDRARESLRALYDTWRKASRTDRVRIAIERWADELDNGIGLDVDSMIPLVRLGSPALGAIRRRRDTADALLVRSAWEIASAAITGVVDARLVPELAGGGENEKIAACRIVAAAGSRSWLEILDALQSAGAPVCHAASRTLGACHRLDAIDRLKKAAASDRANYSAGYAVQELQAWGQ